MFLQIRMYGLSENRLIEYLYFECYVSQGLTFSVALNQYSDYMRMVNDMEYGRIEKYPKALRTIHDVASMNYNIKLNKEEERKWDELYDKNKHLTSSYKDWVIFPPKTPKELRNEGNQLSHCVGSYVNNVVKGNCIILFLRNKQDLEKSVITIEVRDNCIVQARGSMNSMPSIKHDEAIEKLADKLDLKISYKGERVY